MKTFWTVIGVCLMVLSTATGDNIDDSVISFTINKITKTAEVSPDVNVTVTVKPNKKVTDISYLILTIIRNSSSSEPEYTTQLTGVGTIWPVLLTPLDFAVTSDVVKPGSVTFILTAHDTTSITLAFGQVEFELTEINPDIDWVGAENGTDPKPSVRVKTDIDIILNDQRCPTGTTYLLEPSLNDPIEACIEGTSDQKDNPLFCDETIEVGEFTEIDYLTSIVLTHDTDGETISLEVKGTYLDDSSTMEIVFYDPISPHNQTHTFNCNITDNAAKSCKADGRIMPSVNPFNILFVAINTDGNVTESAYKTRFEDYQTTGQALPTNLLEVGWTATDDGPYNVSLASEVPPLFSIVSIDCPVGERCVSYFLNINESSSYVASVKNATDDLNIVAARADMESSDIVFTVDKIVKKSVAGINSELTLDVTVTPSSNISGVKDLTLAIVRTGGVSVTEVITKTAGMELTTESDTLSFNVTEDAVRNGLTTFIIVAHNQSDVALAAGQVQFDLQAITSQINWVGAASGSTDLNPSLRVQTNISIMVDDQECEPGITYFLEYSPPTENIEVCLQATNTQGNTSLFCDATIQVGEFTEIKSLTSVALIYETNVTTSLEVKGGYLDDSTAMEIIFYNSTSDRYNEALTCNISSDEDKVCKTDATSPYSANPFNILLVALDTNGVVTESALKTRFEDYKTTGQGLLPDLMEVGWTVYANATYDISLTPGVPPSFSTVSIHCDENQTCSCYFVNLNESSYVASVKNNEAENVNIVAATVDMESPVTVFTIENITKTKDDGSDVSVSVIVSPDSPVSNIIDLTLVILRTDGDSVTYYFAHITDKSSIEGSTSLDFSIQKEALASGLVTFIIVAHNAQTVGLAAGKVQLNLQDINADINWVGAAAGTDNPKPSLRVHTNVDILVDGHVCEKEQTTYLLEHSQTPEGIQVCLPSNQGDNPLFCDATIPVGNFTEIQDSISIALIYAIDGENTSLEVKANYLDNSTTMEIVFYDNPTELIYNDTFTCSISSNADKTCTTGVISTPSSNPFNILLVAVDGDEKVIESTLKKGFEDYKTKAKALTEDLMEVDFTVKDVTNYHVSIDPKEAAFSEVFVDCDKTACVTYFLELVPGTTYVASVQKTDDDKNIVAATVLMIE